MFNFRIQAETNRDDLIIDIAKEIYNQFEVSGLDVSPVRFEEIEKGTEKTITDKSG